MLRPCGRERIDEILRRLKRSVPQGRAPRQRVEPVRKIRPLAVEHRDPEITVMLELVIGLADRAEGRNVDAVLRLHPVDPDQEHALGRPIEDHGGFGGGRSRGGLLLRLGQRRPRGRQSGCRGGAGKDKNIPAAHGG
jgi:hypothetical protein